MKASALLIFLASLFVSVTAPSSSIAKTITAACILQDENDGSSYEKAIVITETSETTGVPAEYKWLHAHYPGYKMKKQVLSPHDGKTYDILYIKYKGKKKTVYFDITAFFGKF